jgi:hypothetical protein
VKVKAIRGVPIANHPQAVTLVVVEHFLPHFHTVLARVTEVVCPD